MEEWRLHLPCVTAANASLQERTPGVGMELNSPSTAPPPSEVGEEERKKIQQLEAQIEEACRKEDYDLAGILANSDIQHCIC